MLDVQKLFCNHDDRHQNIRWVHWMHTAVIYRYAFPWKSFHQTCTITEKNFSVVAEKSFQNTVTYCLTPINNLLKPLNSHI